MYTMRWITETIDRNRYAWSCLKDEFRTGNERLDMCQVVKRYEKRKREKMKKGGEKMRE